MRGRGLRPYTISAADGGALPPFWLQDDARLTPTAHYHLALFSAAQMMMTDARPASRRHRLSPAEAADVSFAHIPARSARARRWAEAGTASVVSSKWAGLSPVWRCLDAALARRLGIQRLAPPADTRAVSQSISAR